MQCEWIQTDEREYTCVRCGAVLSVPVGLPIPPRFEVLPPCRARTATADAQRFATAIARWVAAGMPIRAAGEIAALHDICNRCEYYDAGRETCRLCGCPVSRNKGWRNKLRMATESCPAKPPRWTATVEHKP